MTTNNQQRTFFYAMKDAQFYDQTIEWVAPCYRLMHETMLQLAVESQAATAAKHSFPPLALDIGCGTGIEGIGLLRKLPALNLVGVDLCLPMLEEFKRNAADAGVETKRYALNVTDILSPSARTDIERIACNAFAAKQFQIIVSAFTFHHFDKQQRNAAFRLVLQLLARDGVFLLGDLFNYNGESAWLTDVIQDLELSWIANNFEANAQKALEQGQPSGAERLRRLKDDWIRHYLHDNKLSSVSLEMQELREAGFTEVGNPFRYWQVGLLWAKNVSA